MIVSARRVRERGRHAGRRTAVCANVDVSSYVLGDNTFSNDHPRPVSIYPNGQANQAVSVTGTAFGDTFKGRDNAGDHGLSNGPFTFTGGPGNDVYYVSSGDTVIEAPNQGTDEVRTTTSFTLPANVENLHAARRRQQHPDLRRHGARIDHERREWLVVQFNSELSRRKHRGWAQRHP